MHDDVGEPSAAARSRDLPPPVELELHEAAARCSAEGREETDVRRNRERARCQDNLERRVADREMLKVLAASGFAGSQYDRFIDQLVRYSVAVLCGWMHSGFIFRVLSERGRGVGPHERELEQLAWDSDLRDQLATMTAACALPKFRERALIEGGWTVEGGSNITSYFVGACLIEFPNVFRAYRAGEGRHLRSLSAQRHTYESATCLPDAVDEVLGKQQVLDRLKDIKDPRTLAVVALTIDGYTQEEICEVLGAESTRAVEGLLYRWRQKEKKHVREAGESG